MLSELCIVIFGIGILMTLSLPVHEVDLSYYTYGDAYLKQQALSLAEAAHTTYEADNPVTFNANGNVTQAKTIYFQSNRKIIIELGGGRIVYE